MLLRDAAPTLTNHADIHAIRLEIGEICAEADVHPPTLYGVHVNSSKYVAPSDMMGPCGMGCVMEHTVVDEAKGTTLIAF
jgi:hypothetical protein